LFVKKTFAPRISRRQPLLLLWLVSGLLSNAPEAAQSTAIADPIRAELIHSDPIHIIENDWTSQRVLSRIAGVLFQKQGYPVRYQQSSVSEQWGALAHGIDHVQLEVWQGTMEASFSRLAAAGKILDAGNHTATTREDWWYPLYVEKLCPGLPDWRALQRCSAIFATPKPEAARVQLFAVLSIIWLGCNALLAEIYVSSSPEPVSKPLIALL